MKKKLIEQYHLTEQEVAYLDLLFAKSWLKRPAMYIGTMRKSAGK